MKKEFYKKSLESNADFKSTCENILFNLYRLMYILANIPTADIIFNLPIPVLVYMIVILTWSREVSELEGFFVFFTYTDDGLF